jgi:hypothetical protein
MSEIDKLDDLVHHLHQIIEKLGYPETKKMDSSMDDAEAELKEEMGRLDEDNGEEDTDIQSGTVNQGKGLHKLPGQI